MLMFWLYQFICNYSTFSVKCSFIELSLIKKLCFAYNKVNKYTDHVANKKIMDVLGFLWKENVNNGCHQVHQ
jgi:hypothetical protein